MSIQMVFVKEEYFRDHADFTEMLDPGNTGKQASRNYMFFRFEYKENNILVPLRSNIPNINKLGYIAYKVESPNRPNAGLDYRKILIINDNNYLEFPQNNKISNIQMRAIETNYEKIKQEVEIYIDGYIIAANKNHHLKNRKYCFSTLQNFHKELEIIHELNNIKPKEIELLTNKNIEEKIKLHKEWLQSKGQAGEKLVLDNENLNGFKFWECDLRYAEITNCDLSNCVFYADLSEATFRNNKIDNTKWVGSDIKDMKTDQVTKLSISETLKNNKTHDTLADKLKVRSSKKDKNKEYSK